MIFYFLDLILNIDKNLAAFTIEFGPIVYIILFLIIFIETGFVVTPFLPGDSLLFVSGALAASGALDIRVLLVLFTIASIAGDTVNYWIGSLVGSDKVVERYPRFIKREWLDYTGTFFKKYGGLTIIIARFVPYIRTFAPFLAGVGEMRYRTFLIYNIIGGILWSLVFVLGGYYIGAIPVVKENFGVVMWLVLGLSLFAILMILHRVIQILFPGNRKKEVE